MKSWNVNRVLTQVNAPMGRYDIGIEPHTITSGNNGKIFKKHQIKIYDKPVNLTEGGYDIGGVYWGIGRPLRVRFNADLTFIQYYRC